MCIFGTPEEGASLEEGSSKPATDKPELSTSATAVKLFFCVAGLQISYLTWGVLQERVMTQGYETKAADGSTFLVKFKDSQFIVFMNRILALVVAGIYIMLTRQPRHTAPLYKYSYSSFSNIMSSWCQYEALKYVSFPTQVLCKASKVIPVMLMGKIVSRKTYPYHEYVVAVLLSVGVSLFLLSAKTSKSSVDTTFAGACILIGYMAFDSFTSNWQSELFTQYKMSSMQMMFGANIFSVLFTVGSLLQTGGFFTSVSFMLLHSKFAYHIFLLSITSATGQLFIFYTISQFGPLLFTIIMTTRQVLSILLSCIIYNHPLAFQAIVGVSVVFLALFLRIYARFRIQRAKNSANKAISKV